jgi:hypothetical protein
MQLSRVIDFFRSSVELTTPTPRIFICYRRSDTAGHAGRLLDALRSHFGADHVYMDIDMIEPGVDFSNVIAGTLDRVDVVIALIGRDWLHSSDNTGRRRLDNPDDFVRLELEDALQRGKRVIPVLIQGASMPSSDDLPPALAALAYRHALELADTRWQYGVQQLIASLEGSGQRSAEVLPSRAAAEEVKGAGVLAPFPRAHVFVSYASEDRVQVIAFVDRLRQQSVPIWIDDGDIDAALLWGEVIVEAIEQCAAFVVMLSGSAGSSPNVVRELVLASEYTKPIVPLLLEPMEIPRSMRYQLAGIQHINLYDRDQQDSLHRVLRSLQRLGLPLDRAPVAG